MNKKVLITVGVGLFAACNSLDVTDPTRIQDEDVANAEGAVMLRSYALRQLYRAIPYTALYGGLLADELMADPAPTTTTGMADYELADRRWTSELMNVSVSYYQEMTSARWKAREAISVLSQYGSSAVRGPYISQMYAVRGLAEVMLAENFCAGLPLNEAVAGRVISGQPLSTEQIFAHALGQADSALAQPGDSARIRNLARSVQARALLGMGRFEEAAAAANEIPTSFLYEAEFLNTTAVLNVLGTSSPNSWFGVADKAGINGLDYVSASDPRIEVIRRGPTRDGIGGLYTLAKYQNQNAPMVIASGIDARLIEAEAALVRGDPSWLTILNTLRATSVTPALAPLSDPGSADARLELLFRERAFWLFATGRRLGDMRRLIAHHGRSADSVFPTGAYRLGGTYEGGTSLPFDVQGEARFNPAVQGCVG